MLALRRLLIAMALLSLAGCVDMKALRTEERMAQGLVLLLPGSAGTGMKDVARGLDDGGIRLALVEDDWTTGFPLLWIFHMRGTRYQRGQATRIAGRIVEYQSMYPGRPVYLIAHSSGAAVAVMILESLPEPATVTGVMLLGASLSREYDLSTALQRVEDRVWNFYSRGDWVILGAGTALTGTSDGRYGASAGAMGFEHPSFETVDKQMLYDTRLREFEYTFDMAGSGHFGGHYGWTNRHFVKERLAPLLTGMPVPPYW